MTSPTAPDWPHCGHGADPATDAVGCRGAHVPGHSLCLSHLGPEDRAAYFDTLQPGSDVDLRGTRLDESSLLALFAATRHPYTGWPVLGQAQFEAATFTGRAHFEETTFQGAADFREATFAGDSRFDSAAFTDSADFTGTTFTGNARFLGAVFHRDATFRLVDFGATAWFDMATFHDEARFFRTTFTGNARFDQALFRGGVTFASSTFQTAQSLGRFVCEQSLSLSMAVFHAPFTLQAAATRVSCRRTQWEKTATLQLRHATLDLTDAVLTQPVAVTAAPPVSEESGPWRRGAGVEWAQTGVSVESVQGVDCAMLTLTDVDLTSCRFAGSFHLDQLRLEGRYILPSTPSGVRRRGVVPVRWTPRRTLAEEQHWRAVRAVGADGWASAPDRVAALEPIAIAPVYRQLRKAFEDGKHEPGAADFYYGEMEMRRHADDIPLSERLLLTAYWALSGYGLRAARALGWLVVTMLTTIVLMMGFGLPEQTPRQEIVRAKVDGRWTSIIDKTAVQNPTGDRFNSERFEKALNVTLNSVVFRTSGQDLTTAGGYIEMASRFAEPVLLGFAALAIRGRVKRGN